MRPDDPTTDRDAVGYLRAQAALSSQNGREAELSDKCAEYLRSVIEEVARLRAALEEIRESAQYQDECNIASMAEAALAGRDRSDPRD